MRRSPLLLTVAVGALALSGCAFGFGAEDDPNLRPKATVLGTSVSEQPQPTLGSAVSIERDE